MNKKTRVAILGIIALVLVTIGLTYAYWLVTKIQTKENVISSGCLDISLTNEANDIDLTEQFPLSDEDGMELTPYTFTVTNNCNTSVDYQIALEAIGEESASISSDALKVALNDNARLFSSYAEVDTTVEGAYEARRLGFSRLSAKGSEGASDSHSLRIWIDANADISEMNKTFTSKISVTIGQGIHNTLKDSILASYGGADSIETIDQESTTETITSSGNLYIGTSDNYYYGTEKVYNQEEGTYTLGGTLVQAKISECRSGTKTCGKYTLKQTTSAATSATIYEITEFGASGVYVTAKTIEYTNEFGNATTADEAGLYKLQDDLGDSYYFRGASTDNYVQFGSYAAGTTVNGVTYDIETPLYWRIVRINGDGTIRLIYDGTEKIENGLAKPTADIGDTIYNHSCYDCEDEDQNVNNECWNLYNVINAGYTYTNGDGNHVDSEIKKNVDDWYNSYFKGKLDSYIADGIFCNDQEVISIACEGGSFTEPTSECTDYSGAEYTYGYYGSYKRFYSKKPSLLCRKNDCYTVEDVENGNGLLSNPVGLITSDEMLLAGNAGANNTNYLYTGDNYWTISPSFWDGYGGASILNSSVFYVQNDGKLSGTQVNGQHGVRPVINLKADVLFTGNGSFETPYEIVTE